MKILGKYVLKSKMIEILVFDNKKLNVFILYQYQILRNSVHIIHKVLACIKFDVDFCSHYDNLSRKSPRGISTYLTSFYF